MSNIEHLFENGLALMKKKTPDEWREQMAKDVNWNSNIGITLDELWLICQYAIYTYTPSIIEDYESLLTEL